jgi:hypothetical protein
MTHYMRSSFIYIVIMLWLPNEDFGRRKIFVWEGGKFLSNEDLAPSKRVWVRPLVRTFHTLEHSIWAKSDEKFVQKLLPKYVSTVQKSSFGEHQFTPPKRRFWKAKQTWLITKLMSNIWCIVGPM